MDEVAKELSFSASNDSSLYRRLKKRYLPELRALHADCVWLKSTLAIDVSRELHPNEAKLLQFLNVTDSVIKELSAISESCDSNDLLALENKILRTILPVKERLHERWKQQLELEGKDKISSANSHQSKADKDKKTAPTSKKRSSERTILPRTLAKPAKFTAAHNEDGLNCFASDIIPRVSPDETSMIDQNIFDNMSDCGVDLLEDEEDEAMIDVNNFAITSPETSSLSDSTTGKRKLASLSSMKREKQPGPYYSSAIDIDLKSSFSNSMVTLKEEEYFSSRRRRKLNQIVPYPRKPRQADYACSLCSEPYQCTVNDNPWWAVYKHECPHCKQHQIPRIDIGLLSNAIELDPNVIALYGEGIEESGDDAEDSDEYTDDEGGGEDDDEEDDESRSQMKKAEELTLDGEGLLSTVEASKLIVLMCHARTCSGNHSSPKHEEICLSTKFLMLHVRDCKGTDSRGKECSFPWCVPCKKLSKHLTRCQSSSSCFICAPWLSLQMSKDQID